MYTNITCCCHNIQRQQLQSITMASELKTYSWIFTVTEKIASCNGESDNLLDDHPCEYRANNLEEAVKLATTSITSNNNNGTMNSAEYSQTILYISGEYIYNISIDKYNEHTGRGDLYGILHYTDNEGKRNYKDIPKKDTLIWLFTNTLPKIN